MHVYKCNIFILSQHYRLVCVIKIDIFKDIGGIPSWKQLSWTEASA